MLSKRDLLDKIMALEVRIEKLEEDTKVRVVKELDSRSNYGGHWTSFETYTDANMKDILLLIIDAIGYELQYKDGQRKIKPGVKFVKKAEF